MCLQDTITEANIQSALNTIRTGRTVISIAHRLSTIKDAHQIIVLANGVVEERGTHDELLARKGRYFQLWTQQAAAAQGIMEATPETANGSITQTPSASPASDLSAAEHGVDARAHPLKRATQ